MIETINEQDQTITYTAIPYPIPEPLRTELIRSAKNHQERSAVIDKIKQQYGVTETRKLIVKGYQA